MGLFWSLQPAPGQKRGLRLMKRNARQPYDIQVNVLSDHATSVLDVLDHTRRLAGVTVYRLYAARNVTAFDVCAGSLRGRLYLPPGKSRDSIEMTAFRSLVFVLRD